MYCSACGVAVSQGLTYCNYCGAKVGGAADNALKSSGPRPEYLVFAMMAVFIFGVGAITLLMGMMKSVLGLPVETVLAFALLPFLIMLLLEGVFIRLLLRRNRGFETSHTSPSKEQVTNELDAAHARALSEPMPSVTEHTTRAFAPIHNERTSK